jgi:hypothetical protein
MDILSLGLKEQEPLITHNYSLVSKIFRHWEQLYVHIVLLGSGAA